MTSKREWSISDLRGQVVVGVAIVILTLLGQIVIQSHFAEKHELKVAIETADESGSLAAIVRITNQGNTTEHAIRGIVDFWGVGLQSDLESSEGHPQSVGTGLSVTENDPGIEFVDEYALQLDRLNPGETVAMHFAITGQLQSIVGDVQSDSDSDSTAWRP